MQVFYKTGVEVSRGEKSPHITSGALEWDVCQGNRSSQSSQRNHDRSHLQRAIDPTSLPGPFLNVMDLCYRCPFCSGRKNPIPSTLLSPFWCANQAYWQIVLALNGVARQRLATITVQRFDTIILSPAAQKDIQACTKIGCLIYCSGSCGASVALSCRSRQKIQILLLYKILWNYFSNYYKTKLLFISRTSFKNHILKIKLQHNTFSHKSHKLWNKM